MYKKLIYLIFFAVVLIVAQSASADLVGHWLLDGDGTDASGNGLDGTINGNVVPTADKSGNPDSAMLFGGTSGDYVDIGDPPELQLTGAMTLAAWVVLDSSNTNNARIFAKAGGGGSRSWTLNIEASTGGVTNPATMQLSPDGGVNISISDSDPLPTDEWVHMAGVYRPGEAMEIYVNGELKVRNTSNVPASQFSNNNRNVLIGSRNDCGNCGWPGSIDDVRIYNEALTADGIIQVMIGMPPGAASNPNPANEATDVPRDVVLSWTPGEFAPPVNGHTVYLSENFNDVNDGIGGVTQSADSYAPAQRFDFETNYYWRVDEVNAPPESTVFEGDVWSFTTEPIAYPIAGERITVTASSQSENQEPENTLNGSGLDANDLHLVEPMDMWLSGEEKEPNRAWIEYELDKVYKLHEMWVWNHNGTMESAIGIGFKDVTIEYSVNGTDYTILGTTHEFIQAPGTPDYAHNTSVDLSGVAAKHVRLTANSNWGEGLVSKYGLSEVRFFYIPVRVREPSPGSGATDVDVDVTLGFRAGREADKHDVYLSTDEQVVIDGNVPVATVAENSYGPLSPDLGTTYYWKINEVNEAETTTMWQGDIWNFTTHEYFVVDDFEDYNDYSPNEIWATWIDGYGVPTNGATSGYPEPIDFLAGEHYMETTIVHGGSQSMPFFYDNTGTAAYSEATRTFAVPQDWTTAGIKTLALWFHGTAGNTGQLYVNINDTKVPYDSDASNLALAGWQPWNIDLTSLGVSLQSVTTLAIGIDGNGANGILYFDDIRLYSYSRQFITPVEPNNAGLVGHWKFDEGSGNIAVDSSGNGRDGTISGADWISPGWDGTGYCLDFDGQGTDRVSLGTFDVSGDAISIACWFKADNLDTPGNDPRMVSKAIGGSSQDHWFMVSSSRVGSEKRLRFRLKTDGDTGEIKAGPAGTIELDVWIHVVASWDGSTMRLYKNGVEVGSLAKGGTLNTNPAANVSIGNQPADTGGDRPFDGLIDEVLICNQALSEAEIAWLVGRTLPFDKPF